MQNEVRQPPRMPGMTRELRIGFVDDDQRLAGAGLQHGQHVRVGQRVAGGIVRRAQVDQLDLRRQRGFQRRQVEREPRLAPQRHADHARALDARRDRVHAEGGRTDQHRVAARGAERTRQQVDAFVAAAADQELLRRDAIERRQRLDQFPRLWLRIAIESGTGLVVRHPPRRFVGVQALEPRVPGRVFIGLQRQDLGAREGQRIDVHGRSPRSTASRRVTAPACASSPSRPASVAAVGPRSSRPAGVISCTVIRLTKSSSDRPL